MRRSNSVSIVGAGSRYTPGILKMLVSEKERFPLHRLTLYDNEPERLEKVFQYGQILFKEYYPECEIIQTLDPEEAFTDIGFAFMQIRAGRLKMRESDEKIALKYHRIGQETCGAGGFAYGMRSIPAVVDIIKDIRKYAPEAWILNYSNPAAIVAEATKRIFKDDYRIINICDMPIAIMGFYAKALDKDVSELEPRYFGLNHFGWFTKILDKKTGYDYLPELQKIFKTPLAAVGEIHPLDQSWFDTFRFMSTMINDYEDYLPNTYLQYYLYPDHLLEGENPEYTRANEVMDGHEKLTFEMLDKVIENGHIKGTEYELKEGIKDGHAGYIVDLADSIAYNKNEIFLCMTENTGIISNLTEGMMVEVPCRVGSNGVEPLNVGKIPTFHKGLLENQYAYEKLTVDACLEGSYKYAWQALTLNRLVNDTQVAKKLLDEYIVANKGYWPELK
ncbi:MAG: 6-phospho-alpha-glucosidase [Erysipelotrichaceae bacterium]|nr:6-phospho-alpha-glucosidase [Erysipelotrichaceae bacterium]